MIDVTHGFSELLADLQWEVNFAAPEVVNLARTRSGTLHSQWQDKLSLGGDDSSAALTKRIAGLANGAIAERLTTSYLVFGKAESTYREKTPDGMRIRRLEDIPPEVLQITLAHLCTSFINPAVLIELSWPDQQDYAFLRIEVQNSSPIYYLDRTAAGDTWMLPVPWATGEDVAPARQKLYDLYITELARGFEDVEPDALKDCLHRHGPTSAHEVAGFLASLLLRTKPQERAIAAKGFGLLGGLSDAVRNLIAPLLLSLIEDEPDVAVPALESLLTLGRDTHASKLIAGLPRFAGDKRMTELTFRCIGELGSRACVQQLLSLAGQSDLPITSGSHLDAALVRLYERHKIELFDARLRHGFDRDLTHFHYKQAQESLDSYGPQICLARTHRRAVHTLVDHAAFLLDNALEEALKVLKNCQESFAGDEPDTDLMELIRMRTDQFQTSTGELRELDQDGRPPKNAQITPVLTQWRLALLFFDLDRAYIERDYEQFLALIYNYVEKCALFMAARAGVDLQYKAPQTTESDGPNSITITLEAGWIEKYSDMLSTTVGRKELHARVDRLLLKKILRVLTQDENGIMRDNQETAGTTRGVVRCQRNAEISDVLSFLKLTDQLECLIRIRHTVKTGHGLENTTEERITAAYDASEFTAIITDIRNLHAHATGEMLGENSFITLNRDIRWILQRADSIPPSFRLLHT